MTLRLGVLGADGLHSAIIARYLNVGMARDPRARVDFVYDEDPEASAALASAVGARAVSSPAEMTGVVDGVLVVNRYGDDHTRNWEEACDLGVPIFVDKPMAQDFAAAKWMTQVAESTGVRLFSASHFRLTPELGAQGVFLPALAATVSGPRLTALVDDERRRHLHPSYYGIHVIEIGQAVMGPGVRSLRARRRRELDTVVLDYPDGRVGVVELINNLQLDWRVHVVDAYSFHVRTFDVPHAPAQYHALVEAILDFMEHGVEIVPVADTLECLAILDAIELSVQRGGADVVLDELRAMAE